MSTTGTTVAITIGRRPRRNATQPTPSSARSRSPARGDVHRDRSLAEQLVRDREQVEEQRPGMVPAVARVRADEEAMLEDVARPQLEDRPVGVRRSSRCRPRTTGRTPRRGAGRPGARPGRCVHHRSRGVGSASSSVSKPANPSGGAPRNRGPDGWPAVRSTANSPGAVTVTGRPIQSVLGHRRRRPRVVHRATCARRRRRRPRSPGPERPHRRAPCRRRSSPAPVASGRSGGSRSRRQRSSVTSVTRRTALADGVADQVDPPGFVSIPLTDVIEPGRARALAQLPDERHHRLQHRAVERSPAEGHAARNGERAVERQPERLGLHLHRGGEAAVEVDDVGRDDSRTAGRDRVRPTTCSNAGQRWSWSASRERDHVVRLRGELAGTPRRSRDTPSAGRGLGRHHHQRRGLVDVPLRAQQLRVRHRNDPVVGARRRDRSPRRGRAGPTPARSRPRLRRSAPTAAAACVAGLDGAPALGVAERTFDRRVLVRRHHELALDLGHRDDLARRARSPRRARPPTGRRRRASIPARWASVSRCFASVPQTSTTSASPAWIASAARVRSVCCRMPSSATTLPRVRRPEALRHDPAGVTVVPGSAGHEDEVSARENAGRAAVLGRRGRRVDHELERGAAVARVGDVLDDGTDADEDRGAPVDAHRDRLTCRDGGGAAPPTRTAPGSPRRCPAGARPRAG